MVNLWGLREEIAERGPSEASSRDSLFGEQIIEDQESELSTSFYAERNPADQASPHPFQPFFFNDYQPPSPLELPTDPVGPMTMMSYMNLVPQNGAHTKGYGLNKPTPFSSDQTKVKAFLQGCLVYIDMNEDIYMTDKLKIGFVLSYMNEKEAKDWQELYLEDLKNPATGKLVYLTFGAVRGHSIKLSTCVSIPITYLDPYLLTIPHCPESPAYQWRSSIISYQMFYLDCFSC